MTMTLGAVEGKGEGRVVDGIEIGERVWLSASLNKAQIGVIA